MTVERWYSKKMSFKFEIMEIKFVLEQLECFLTELEKVLDSDNLDAIKQAATQIEDLIRQNSMIDFSYGTPFFITKLRDLIFKLQTIDLEMVE